MKDVISQSLTKLKWEADTVAQLFPKQNWIKVHGPGPDQIEQHGSGFFNGMVWEPDSTVELKCNLTIPEKVRGVSLINDPLEAVVSSLYPVSLCWDHQTSVFEEDRVPVAAGPALATVIPHLKPGDNGELDLRVQVPNNQTTQWFTLRFTTPGLRKRFELLDTAWAEIKLAESIATTQAEHEAVSKAAALLPQDLTIFDEKTLLQIELVLNALSDKAKRLFVHVIGHSHIDMNWLWTWPDTINVILRDFKSVLEMMQDYPELTFTHSQPATYEVVRLKAPELFERMLNRIREGRWEPATMTWVEGDENMASGEALARQLLAGVSYSLQKLDYKPAAFLAPDTFGHPGNLPQLAASAGAKCYYHHRCNPGAENPWPAYWWEGQDGTRLLAISTPSFNGDIRARDLVGTALHALEHGLKHSLHFHGVGDHGGGPARQNLEALRRFQKRPLLPSAFCSTLAAYTKDLLDSGVSLPVHHGELNKIFEGCYTTHADIKRYNRFSENQLCTAETLALLAGLDRRETLDEAWREVLFNQFHDILDGSAIHESYEKSVADFSRVFTVAETVTQEALQVLSGGFEGGTIVVTNPLGWERSGWAALPGKVGDGSVNLISDQGHQTTGQYSRAGFGFVARVPAFGSVSYKVNENLPIVSSLSITPSLAPTAGFGLNPQDLTRELPYYRIETPFFTVYVRRDSGIITSLVDKRDQRELVGFGMRHAADYFDTARPDLALNVIQFLEERPHPMSAWHMDEIFSEQSLIYGATTSVEECGAARIVLEVKHDWRSSQIFQEIIFYRDLPQIDFKMRINWQEIGNSEKGVPNLKVAFTASLPDAEAWFETPFAAIQRPCDGQEVPALRWADTGGPEYGIALINDSKYGYDILGTRLRMTLVRSAYEPDIIADLGWHEIQFSLLPHPGNWRTAGIVQAATGSNQPLLAVEIPQEKIGRSWHSTWRPQVAGSASILLSGLKLAQNGKGKILRVYESSGIPGEIEVRGIPEEAQVWETNIIEDKLQQIAVVTGCVRLAFHPWQVRTILVEN